MRRTLRSIHNGFVLLLLMAPLGWARQQAWLFVETNLPEAVVWVDSVPRGLGPQTWLAVEPGNHEVTLVPPEDDTWLLPRPRGSVTVMGGDSALVSLPFPHVYQIQSTPFDAKVWLGQSETGTLLGLTPLLLSLSEPLGDSLTVARHGFLPVRRHAGVAVLNRLFVSLEPEDSNRASSVLGRTSDAGRSRGRWIPFVSAGWAIASGALAIHYKSKADNLYDQYRLTGDPTLRPAIRRNDTRSAIALGGLQVGVGVLALKLVLY